MLHWPATERYARFCRQYPEYPVSIQLTFKRPVFEEACRCLLGNGQASSVRYSSGDTGLVGSAVVQELLGASH